MTKEELKEQILHSLEKIIEKTKAIEAYKTEIPQIEIDITLDYIKNLYENYKSLSVINIKPVIPNNVEERLEQIISKSEESYHAVPKNEDIETVSAYLDEASVKSEEEIEASLNSLFEEPQKTNQEEVPTPVKSNETVADKFKTSQQSLNEKMASTTTEQSIGLRLQKNPIKDLKDGIGLNEKFLFINDLFKGNDEDYKRAIAKLNQMPDLTGALEIVNSLKLRYKWNEKPEAYETLLDLVKRRYMG